MSVTALLEHPAIIGGVEKQLLDGDEMRRRRTELGWTLRHLADRAGVSWRTAQNAEHGEQVRDQTARAILRALDEGEEERRKADQPDLETWTLELDGVRVVVTGERGKLQALDLNALTRPRKD